MDQDVQSRVEELEQNVQAKDRELAQKVLLHIVDLHCVCMFWLNSPVSCAGQGQGISSGPTAN